MDPEKGITRVEKLVDVVVDVTPCMNHIVTPVSNAVFALKCGNAIIITPHYSSVKCST